MKNIYSVPVSFQSIKRVLLSCLLALFGFTVHAQVGIGTIAPHSSAQLEIQAPLKGLLIPRMPEIFRNLIPTPATGLLVYQTDGVAPGFYYFDGVVWQPLKSAASSGGGAIIPYASGAPIEMTTLLGGLAGTTSVLGFGTSATGISLIGGSINAATLTNFAYSVPRSGTITSISGFFSVTLGLNIIGSSLDIHAQLFSAPAGSNLFLPVPGAVANLTPSLTGVVNVGDTASGTTSGLSIPVIAGSRLLLVYSTTMTGFGVGNVVTGYASAGVSID
jgi:BclB C-terminal domain-containing protein